MSELLKPLSHIRRAKGSQFVGQIFWFLSLRSSFTTVDKPENFDPTKIEHLVQPRYTRLLYYFTHAKEMTVLNFNIHECKYGHAVLCHCQAKLSTGWFLYFCDVIIYFNYIFQMFHVSILPKINQIGPILIKISYFPTTSVYNLCGQ